MAVAVDSAYLLSNQIINDMIFYRDLLSVIGLFYVGKSAVSLSCKLFSSFRTHVLSKIWQTGRFPVIYGKWAVVLNGSEGFGKAYAEQLALRGMNIVLIGTHMQTLRKVAIEIERDSGVETLCIQCNFDDPDMSNVYNDLWSKLQNIDVGILVNSIEFEPIEPTPFVRCSKEVISRQVNLSVSLTTMVTRMLLPHMLERLRGAIINISSLTICSPNPYQSVYSATKAYIEMFSRSLEEECSPYGVHVQTLCPGYVSQTDKNPLIPSVDVYVRHAVSTLPFTHYTAGYWLHSLQAWLLSCLPERARVHINYMVRAVLSDSI